MEKNLNAINFHFSPWQHASTPGQEVQRQVRPGPCWCSTRWQWCDRRSATSVQGEKSTRSCWGCKAKLAWSEMIWNRWVILNPNLQYFFASERDWRYSRPLPMFAFDDWVRGLLGNHVHWVEGRVEGPILSTLSSTCRGWKRNLFSSCYFWNETTNWWNQFYTLFQYWPFFCLAGTTLVIGGNTKGRC